MSDFAEAAKAAKKAQQPAPAAKPAEPLTAYRVTVRHTPLRPEHKRRVVQAATPEGAWQAYVAEVGPLLTEAAYKNEPRRLRASQDWFAQARQGGVPEGAEVLPDEYLKRRMEAIRVKGAVRREDVGGFAELASK